MVIEQHGRPIGHAHRRVERTPRGWRFADESRMRITTMGVAQSIAVATRAELAADLSLESFGFELRSGLGDFSAHGRVADQELLIESAGGRSRLPLSGPIYLAGSLLPAAWQAGLAPGQRLVREVFDPATLGRRPVEILAEARETLQVQGRPVETLRVALTLLGTTQRAWIGPDGSVLQEQGLLGLRLRRAGRDEALAAGQASSDLTLLASIDPGRPLALPREASRLRLRLDGLNPQLQVNGGRQTYDPLTGELVVMREGSDAALQQPPPGPEALGSSLLVQADHPAIGHQVAQLGLERLTPRQRAERLVGWIHGAIARRPVIGVPNALETLERRVGDCNEHAALLAAMARAAGLPALIEAGLVYTEGRFFYHAWNVLWLPDVGWLTADALMNQLPADVTHIRLVRGESTDQLDLLGSIGKLTIQLLEER
jgi:hypothetical protein